MEDVKEALFRHYGAAHFLKISGEIRLRLFEGKAWRPASFALMIQRPDRLRIRAYRPFAPTLFELVSDGDECWLFFPSEKTAYRSKDCEIIHDGGERIGVSAKAIIAAIIVVPDFDELFSSPAVLGHEQGEVVRLTLIEEKIARRDLWIDAKTGLVTRQVLRGADGALEADIAYGEHLARDGVVLPTEMEAVLPRIRAFMTLRLRDSKVNPEMPSGAFAVSLPDDTTIVATDTHTPN